jgi:hypothetical protein
VALGLSLADHYPCRWLKFCIPATFCQFRVLPGSGFQQLSEARILTVWHNFYTLLYQRRIMNTIRIFSLMIFFAALYSCSSGVLGKKVREPFQGSAYMSNNRFWRATGKGSSSQDNIARSKADLDAKAQLAGQVNTTMKQVADQYLSDTGNERAADIADKFQSLVRQVMNTDIADLRKIGEQKYYNEKTKEYTVFIAYEIKKNAMLRFMKRQAKLDQTLSERQRELIEKIIDEELKKADAEDKD